MIAVLLCPGPSLRAGYEPSRTADLTLGVNRAPLIAHREAGVKVDWWVCDYRRFLDVELPYRPGVVVGQRGVWNIHRRGQGEKLRRHVVMTQDELKDWWPEDGKSFCNFSATVAIVAAAHQGATRIECYGCDWTCEPDVDGVDVKGNKRTVERWKREAEFWQRTVDALAGMGVVVERMAA